jgi:carbonic anhydrase
MRELDRLFANNRAWAERMVRDDPEFFARLARQQAPEHLWIGCADSRVPANEIVGLAPGELFVHRNIANVVVQTDFNCLSVLQFAVDLLKVKHVIVCGHYGCSGVRAAMSGMRVGLSDNWLRQVEAVNSRHAAVLERIPDEKRRHDRLCELNVLEQVVNVARTTVVQDAWARGQELNLHAWVYGLKDGLLRDLEATVSRPDEVLPAYGAALERLRG